MITAKSGAATPRTLGTALRRLIELLDGEVSRAYAEAGLDYRAGFTPIMRALGDVGSLSVRDLARAAGVSHGAASQTVAQMRRVGLLDPAPASDGRERRVRLSARAHDLQPMLVRHWSRTEQAAAALDAELGVDLAAIANQAIAIIERRGFLDAVPEGRTDA